MILAVEKTVNLPLAFIPLYGSPVAVVPRREAVMEIIEVNCLKWRNSLMSSDRTSPVFLGNPTAIQNEIQSLMKQSPSLKIAVGFVRRHWRELFSGYAGSVELVCWLSSMNTDPNEVEEMRKRQNFRVAQLNYMHAKVYLAPGIGAVVGSANLSASALESDTAGQWEAAVLVKDPETVAQIGLWFDSMLREQACEITEGDLLEAKKKFKLAQSAAGQIPGRGVPVLSETLGSDYDLDNQRESPRLPKVKAAPAPVAVHPLSHLWNAPVVDGPYERSEAAITHEFRAVQRRMRVADLPRAAPRWLNEFAGVFATLRRGPTKIGKENGKDTWIAQLLVDPGNGDLQLLSNITYGYLRSSLAPTAECRVVNVTTASPGELARRFPEASLVRAPRRNR